MTTSLSTPNSIITPQQPLSNAFVIPANSANTNYTAPTNLVLVANAGVAGGRVTKLKTIPTGTIVATQVQLYRQTGNAAVLTNTLLMGAITVNAVVQIPQSDFGYSDATPLIMDPNEKLFLAVGANAVQINGEVEWSNY